jgi:hypothetical protein
MLLARADEGSSESARIHHLAGLLCHRGPDYCSGAGAGQDQAHPCALAHQLGRRGFLNPALTVLTHLRRVRVVTTRPPLAWRGRP